MIGLREVSSIMIIKFRKLNKEYKIQNRWLRNYNRDISEQEDMHKINKMINLELVHKDYKRDINF